MKTYAKQSILVLALVVLPFAMFGCGGGDSSTPAASSTNDTTTAVKTMTGTWNGAFDGGSATFSLNLSQTDNVLSGTFVRNDGSGSGPATGQIVGNTLDLTTVREPGHTVAQWHGTVNDDRTSANGTYTNITAASSGTFSMSK